MPQMKTNENYYTATKAKEVLGVTHGMLYQYIRNGNLHPVTPPGKKQSVYLKKEVDKLANKLQAFFATAEEKPASKLEQAKEDDLPEVIAISQRIFGNGPGVPPLESRQAWLRKNPDTFYVLKNEGRIVGYTSILPLQQELVNKLVTEAVRGKDISYNDVLAFSPGNPVSLYVMAIGVDPRLPSTEKHIYGSRLIGGLMEYLIELGQQGIVIESITARSYKPDGIRLLRKMGFPELPSPIPDTRLFVINVKESGAPFIMRYKHALRESRR
jgi:Acetyltransferase (GNAT) family